MIISSTGIMEDANKETTKNEPGSVNFSARGSNFPLLDSGNSGSIACDYGLNDRGSIPDRSRGFFF
jgi:hypothetical protein